MYFFYYLPVGLDIPLRRRALITWFLACASVILFLIYRYVPIGSWWNLGNLVFYPAEPSLATSVAHAFLHTGYVHLIGNIVYLVVFGRAVEDRFGPGRFFMIYILSAAAGAYAHLLFTKLFAPSYLMYGVIGASGATSGLLGTFLVRFYFSRVQVAYWIFMPLQGVNRAGRSSVPVALAVLVWFLFQGALTLIQFGIGGLQVAYSVHVGGFAAGAACAFLFGAASQARGESHLEAARRHFRGCNWFAAQGEYLEYLALRPDDAAVHAEAARAFSCSREEGRARFHFAEAVGCFLQRGERDGAERAFTEAMRAIRGFSLPEQMHLDLAYRLERSLKFKSALAAYENFTLSYPRSNDVPFILLRMAGMLERRFRRPELALSYYRQLVDRYPDDVWADFAKVEIDRLERITTTTRPLMEG